MTHCVFFTDVSSMNSIQSQENVLCGSWKWSAHFMSTVLHMFLR